MATRTTLLMEFDLVDCPGCGGPRAVEVPPCADGHGVDCPDRACAECGTAVIVDPVLVPVSRAVSRRAA